MNAMELFDAKDTPDSLNFWTIEENRPKKFSKKMVKFLISSYKMSC